MAFDDVIGKLADLLVSKAIVKFLGAAIERGYAEENEPSAYRLPLGKSEQLRSNAFSPGAFGNGDGGDVRGTGTAIRMDKDESHRLTGLAGHKQFSSRAAKGGAALLDLAVQGDPGVGSRHQLRAPFELRFLRRSDRE